MIVKFYWTFFFAYSNLNIILLYLFTKYVFLHYFPIRVKSISKTYFIAFSLKFLPINQIP